MTTTLTNGGLVEIPEVFRKEDALQPGARCDVQRVARGEYRVLMEEGDADERDWVDVLLACPERGWYVPLERQETTANLKPSLFA
jgi:hypothetical protein